jgi:LysM repeat protein
MRFPRLVLVAAVACAVVVPSVDPAGAETTYQVRSGDSLSVIARRHGVSVDQLVQANRLADPHRIRAGQSLVIPGGGSPSAPAARTYQVRAGDTLGAIAARHGLRVDAVAAANRLADPNRIRVGQLLHLPGASAPLASPVATPTAPAAPATTYVVRQGDVLSVIARRLGTTIGELRRLNQAIADPDRIRAGQVLNVPATGQAPAPPAPAPSTPVVSPPGSVNSYPNLPSRLRNNPDRLALIPVFEEWAAVYGVPVELVMAVAWHESGWQAGAISPKGAIGVGQLMPPTAAWLATTIIGDPSLDPHVAAHNIRMAAAFLAWLHAHMGSRDLAVAAYYQGPASVRRNGLFRVTETYLAAVNALVPSFRPG